jgi:hypothetical protein
MAVAVLSYSLHGTHETVILCYTALLPETQEKVDCYSFFMINVFLSRGDGCRFSSRLKKQTPFWKR